MAKPRMEQLLQGREPYRFPFRPGLQQWVEFPEGWRPDDRRPALVTIHGGGFNSGSPWYLWPQCRYFAMRGCVCIGVEYRLAGGGILLEDAVRDCRSAVRAVRRNARSLGVDPDRIWVLGESAGGYLAVSCAVMDGMDHEDDPPDADCTPNLIIDVNGVVDLTGRWYDGCRRFLPEGCSRGQAAHYSPLHRVRRGLPPLLTYHGSADPVVSPEDSQRLLSAWRACGNEAEALPSPNEEHAFLLFYQPSFFRAAYAATLTLDDELTLRGYLEP